MTAELGSDPRASTELEQELDALESRGARGFDAAVCDAIRRLLTEGEALGGGAAERLKAAAERHLVRLRAQFDAHLARVTTQLNALEELRGEQPALRGALSRGQLTHVARTARRIRHRPLSARRLGERAQAPEAPAPPEAVARPGRRPEPTYEDSVADLVASFALARAADVVPEDAGPYNSLRIATDALARMRALSPLYLTVQLNRLEEIASLMTLPELPEAAPAPERPKALGRKGGTGTKPRRGS